MNNTITFVVYKSHRKNAKCEMVDILHFHNTDKEQDKNKIINALEKVIYRKNQLQAKSIIVSAFLTQNLEVSFQNVNGKEYFHNKSVTVKTNTKEFCSVEQLINFIYECYMLLNTDSKLDIVELHNDPSIRYIIHNYYHG